MGIFDWWAIYNAQRADNFTHYGYGMSNSEIEPYITPEITTEDGEYVIVADNGDKNIGKWWEDTRVLFTVYAEHGEYDTDDATLTYSLSGEHAYLLYINPIWGNVTLKDGGGAYSSTSLEYYNFTVTVTSSSYLNPSVSEDFSLRIVEGGYDPEITTRGGQHIILADNGDDSIGKWWQDTRVLFKIHAENGKNDPDGTLTYSLSGEHASLFYINPIWGNITLKGGGGVDLSTSLEYYYFTVTVTSSSRLNPSVSEDYVLRVVEDGYNPEITTRGGQHLVLTDNGDKDIGEWWDNNRILFDVDAEKGGYDTHGTLTYSLSGEHAYLLDIDIRWGDITFKDGGGVDLSTRMEYYNFTVTVTSSSFPSPSVSEGYMLRIVEDLYDPDIISGNEHVIFTDNGNKNIGKWWQDTRVLLKVEAENSEWDTDGTLTYSISGEHASLLYINPIWGNVTFKGGGGADLSTRMEYYYFTVTVTSSSRLNPSVSEDFTLKIVEGKYNPEIISDNEQVILTDNGDKNIGKWWEDTRVLFRVKAENSEYDTDGTLTYSISGEHGDLFYINPIWGNITFKDGGGADLSTRMEYYNFTVTVISSSYLVNPSVSEEFTLRIVEGEYDPVFTSGDEFSVVENTVADGDGEIYLFTAIAIGGNHSYQFGSSGVYYSMVSGDDSIIIDSLTGEVSYLADAGRAAIDFETQNQYAITIEAIAHYADGSLSQYVATQTVTLSVEDTDDYVEIVTDGGYYKILKDLGDQTIGVWEDDSRILLDVDANTGQGYNGTVTYSIYGEASHLLSIDSVTGKIKFVDGRGADNTRQEYYNFTITATSDAAGNPFASQDVIFHVQNTPNPIFTSEDTVTVVDNDVVENAEGEVYIFTANAYNTDTAAQYYDVTGLTYVLENEDYQDFRIDGETGEVFFVGDYELDFEVRDEYNFTIKAIALDSLGDLTSHVSQQDVSVTIITINEYVSVSLVEGYTGSVLDLTGVNGFVGNNITEFFFKETGIGAYDGFGIIGGVLSHDFFQEYEYVLDYETESEVSLDIVAVFTDGTQEDFTVEVFVEDVNETIIIDNNLPDRFQEEGDDGFFTEHLRSKFTDLDGDFLKFHVADRTVTNADGTTSTAGKFSGDNYAYISGGELNVRWTADSPEYQFSLTIEATDGEFSVYDTFVIDVI